MKKFLTPIEAVFLWGLLFLVPFFALRGSLAWLEQTENRNAREELRLSLLAEAKLCQQHLQYSEFLTERVKPIAAHFGFQTNQNPKAKTRLQGLDLEMHQRILSSIRRVTRGEPWMVFTFGPACQTANWFINPKYLGNMEPNELGTLVASGARALLTNFWPVVDQTRSDTIASWVAVNVNPVLGYNFHLKAVRQYFSPFTSLHSNFGLGYFARWDGPPLASKAEFPRQGHLLVFFHSNDVPVSEIERFAGNKATPGFSRKISWEKPHALPRYEENRQSCSLVTSIPHQDFLKNLLRKNKPLLQQGLQPVLVVRSRARQVGSFSEKTRRYLDLFGYPILFLLLMIFWRVTQLNIPGTWGLSIRLATGFVLCLMPAILGLSLAAVGWQLMQRVTWESQLSKTLQTRLGMLDHTLRHFQEKFAEVLGQRGDKLSGIVSEPRSVVQKALEDTKKEKMLVYQGLFNSIDVIGENLFGRQLTEGLSMLFRTMISQNLLSANPNLPPAKLSQHGSLIMSQTVAEQYMDMDSFGSYMSNPDKVCRSPFGNTQQWYQIRFLRPNPGSLPNATLVNMGNFIFLSLMIRWHFMHRFSLTLPDPVYRLDLLLYRFWTMTNRNFTTDDITSTHFQDDWIAHRPLAFSTVQHLVTKEELMPGPEPRRLVVAKPLSSDLAIGVARATPIRNRAGEQAFFLWSMTGALITFLFTLIGVTSWYLLRPLRAFLQATGKAACGEFDWKLEVQTRDECEDMATAFNQMADKLIERQRISRFVSDDVVKAISDSEEEAVKPGAQKLFSTVLVSDIRSFTTLSEEYSPEEMVSVLNDYFTAMEEAIRAEGGIIVQLIGDAIVAHFPVHSDPPRRSAFGAIRAAKAMRRALFEFNQHRNQIGRFPIRTGIGIASGTIVSAIVGSESGRLAHTLVGVVVDRATDLENFSKNSQATGIMLDSSVQKLLQNEVSILETSDKGCFEVAAID